MGKQTTEFVVNIQMNMRTILVCMLIAGVILGESLINVNTNSSKRVSKKLLTF